MKFLISIFCLFSFIHCFSQKKSQSKINEEIEIKLFMKEFLKDFTFVPYVTETTTTASQMLECFSELKSDTIFTPQEVKH